MSFKGFPKGAVEFFDELEANNNREWFLAHKPVYEQKVRGPMEDLLAELEPKFGPTKIFRINRDTRFAADKSPYKTYIAAVLGGSYLSLSPEGLYVGSGFYRPESDALARFRVAVADDASGREIVRIASALAKKGYEVQTHEMLKSAPKGYTADHPRIDLLRHKDLHAGKGFAPGAWLATRKAFDRVKQVLVDTKALNAWLDRHVRT